MPYAAGRVINDADSHIMESLDWLSSHADPAIRGRLGSMRLEAGGSGAEKAIAKALARRKDPAATAEIASNVVAGPKGWAAYGAIDPGERTKALDDLGFHRQMVFTTFAGSQFLPSKDLDVKYGGARALNRAMAEFCAGDRRLIGVGVTPLDDPKRAAAEIKAAVKLGVGAIWIPAAPAGEVSPGHPDLDPVWAALAEAHTPFVLHVGAGSPSLPPAYHKNGHPRPKDWLGGGENLRSKDFPVLHHSPERFLACMALDGVLERHPHLRGAAIELGATWVPGLLRNLDHAHHSFSKFEPVLQDLPLLPSEYIRRQVRFTPFPFEDTAWLVDQCGPELFMFSTDYPHPEGGKRPFEAFGDAVAGFDEATRERFFWRNGAELLGLA